MTPGTGSGGSATRGSSRQFKPQCRGPWNAATYYGTWCWRLTEVPRRSRRPGHGTSGKSAFHIIPGSTCKPCDAVVMLLHMIPWFPCRAHIQL